MHSSLSRRTLGATLFFVLAALSGCGASIRAASHRDPEVVGLEGALANRYVSAGEESVLVSRLRIVAGTAADARRPHINLALVVDTSGSMEGAAIAQAREASRALLDQLRAGDRLAVVTFDSRTEVLLPSTEIDASRLDELRDRMNGMQARGTTDLAGGLRLGLEEVVRHYDATGINRVVLLSDGVPNDASQVAALAQAAGERHIAITALGLGLEYDETLLAAIAQTSGGRFHFVEEPTAVASVFRDEVLRLERMVARSAVVEITPGPGVTLDGVVAGQWSGSGNAIRVAIGDIAEGEVRDILVRLRVSPRRTGSTVEAIDATLSFDDALEEAGRLERRLYLGARATDDQAELAAGRDTSVERDAARLMAAAQTVQAIEIARTGQLDQARAILAQAEAQATSYAASTGDARLAQQAEQMRVLDSALPATAPTAAPSYEYSEDDARAVRAAHGAAMEMIQTTASQ
ncbi:MAG: VWA domain-containing protein [Sandaracinus sp.]